MELKLKLEYSDLLELIKQLPANQLEKLRSELDSEISKESKTIQSNSIQELLLEGPIMENGEYEAFLANRKYFTEWRTN